MRGALLGVFLLTGCAARQAEFTLSTFSADVTIPPGHRCMGVLPVKAERVADSLLARGFVLRGPDAPIVLAAVDWCEIRNGATDAWTGALAEAAGTTPDRVLLCSLHQHDAPVVDTGAQDLLDQVGLPGELFDRAFMQTAIGRVADALRRGKPRRVTHAGVGRARVERIASSRRVELADGRVTFGRGSSSGGDALFREAPEGEIDPWLRTISFWNDGEPLLALSAYATHPMSRYGKGEVSADFVGWARDRRQAEAPGVFQVYVTGCGGDVTAGKYNDGAPERRAELGGRLAEAMRRAWEGTERFPLRQVGFRSASLELEKRGDASLERTLKDAQAPVRDRILAAMGLSSLNRRDPIRVPCVDLGRAQVVLLPGEAFVGYQLMAQEMRPDSMVMCIGYGECWPGYIPTAAAERDGFTDFWCWVAPGSEPRVRAALERALQEPRDILPPADLKGWRRLPLAKDGKLGERNPWRVDGARQVLVCEGEGAWEMLLWDEDLADGRFHVEWRVTKVDEKGFYNGGVYVRSSLDGKVWHQAQVALQGKPPAVGDLFGMTPVGGGIGRVEVLSKVPGRARPAGEWNAFDLEFRGGTLTLSVNGAETVRWEDCRALKGHVGLQAEFSNLEFRNLRVGK